MRCVRETDRQTKTDKDRDKDRQTKTDLHRGSFVLAANRCSQLLLKRCDELSQHLTPGIDYVVVLQPDTHSVVQSAGDTHTHTQRERERERAKSGGYQRLKFNRADGITSLH
eukprot:COSAG03_NODE_1060_length_4930_cov_9.328089_4_plen_112_part_00